MLNTRQDKPLLIAQNITQRFGATTALSEFSMTVMPGQIHALIGENGAGKSTFIKVLAGINKPNSGSLNIVGSDKIKPAIAFIHQDLGLINGLSAGENVLLGQTYPRFAGIINWRKVHELARQSLDIVGAEFDSRTLIEELSVADRALVAIARAVRLEAKILVLDEPTATLPGHDVARLFSVLARLKQQGMGMIYVSHRLSEILEIADCVTVVRDGMRSHHGPVKGLSENRLIEYMVGKAFTEQASNVQRNLPDSTEVLLSAEGLCTGILKDVSLSVKRGEIIGCVGLRGAGQEALGRALAGVSSFEGKVSLKGQRFSPRSVDDAVRQGISFITGDRDIAIVRPMSLQENLFIHPARTSVSSWLRNRTAERKHTEKVIRDFDVRPRAPEKAIGELSGGNAQKIIFARGLESKPDVVIMEEPTAGVDMPTRYALYNYMRRETLSGTGFIVASSDHEEIAAVCDRVYVFQNGRIASVITEQPLHAEKIAILTKEEAA